MNIINIQCKKPQSKYEELYLSFYVEVTLTSVQFKAALDLFTSAKAWPSEKPLLYFKPMGNYHEQEAQLLLGHRATRKHAKDS